MEDEREIFIGKNKPNYKPPLTRKQQEEAECLELKTFKAFLAWVCLDQGNLFKSCLSGFIFFVLVIAVPLVSHLFYSCPSCEPKLRRPHNYIVQSSLSLVSSLSFYSLSSFAQRYGLRKFLFLDKLSDASSKVRHGYTIQLQLCRKAKRSIFLKYVTFFGASFSFFIQRSWRLLSSFVLPIFLLDSSYKIWWFISGGTGIPYFANLYASNIIACTLLLCSWLYRTSIFFFVCVLFRLICQLLILRLEDFAKVFEKESDVEAILSEHLSIRRNLRVISHRFRVFILGTLIFVTASQLASLLVTTESGSVVNVYTGGELALVSVTLMTGLFICLRSATKITHKAQAVTCLAAKWHICATINSFDDFDDSQPTPRGFSPRVGAFVPSSESDNEEVDGDDVLDNTKMVPIFANTISYQKRQALVTYFENNRSGLTVFGFMLDRTSLHTMFVIQLSLTLWLLNKTIGFS